MITQSMLLEHALPVSERAKAFRLFPKGFEPTVKNCLKAREEAKIYSNTETKLGRYDPKTGYEAIKKTSWYCGNYQGFAWSLWARKFLKGPGFIRWHQELSFIRSGRIRDLSAHRRSRYNLWATIRAEMREETEAEDKADAMAEAKIRNKWYKAQATLFANCYAMENPTKGE
jgi:hypothetical protein